LREVAAKPTEGELPLSTTLTSPSKRGTRDVCNKRDVAIMNLVILGAPGAGKGTQSELLGARLSLPAISTGMMIRQAISEQSEIGLAVKKYIAKGDLVPDEIMVKMINKRLSASDCGGGFILDGYPRTAVQAEELDRSGVKIDKVLSLEVADEEIVARLSGRLQCIKCGASYHALYRAPEKEEVCDVCGSGLTRRADDEPEVIRQRLANFYKMTEPLKDYYAKQGKLCIADGQGDIDGITKTIFQALGIEEE